jgi:Protein of unknown function (DUF2442).
MLEVSAVEPLEGRVVRLTLSNGAVVERDLTDLLARGAIFAPIATDDAAFRRVSVDYGTIVWPGDIDIAPETLIWDGPYPDDESTRDPELFLRPQKPKY